MSRSNDDTSPRQEIIFIMLHIQLSPATTLISLIQSGVISMIKRRMSPSEFVVNIKIYRQLTINQGNKQVQGLYVQ